MGSTMSPALAGAKMKPTEHQQPAALTPVAPSDDFEQIRDAFYARLRSDRVCLMDLGAVLARAEGDASGVFEDIRAFAHRMHGAAAIFEDAGVSIDACALEQAANLAAIAHVDNSDAHVWSALETLVARLAILNGENAR
jgi:hypothetical protein